MIHRICRGLSCAVFGLVVLTTLGCQKEREFAEVEGTITLEGKPIAGIEVLFLPDPEKGNKGNTSTGMTDKAGKYRIYNDRDAKDGTVLGAHRVVLIDSYANVDPSGLNNPPSRIPEDYSDAGRTPLKDVEITSGKQTFDFNLKKPPKK